ncbi:MAG: type IV toxin-antitoxin system AbiEi family antitoxin domain-containing protein [Phycisphaeraceae bacterium]|nr:type IV toxin-antitoxin system AbiEi family antitoxin domain-containing protein [Phycisphaeraceae bacterium]
MDTTTQARILKRVRDGGPDRVFIAKDFLDLGGRAAVDQALARLVRKGALQRVGRGLYHRPRVNPTLGVTVPADPDAVAQAIGRRTGSRVVASPAVAANRLGLSTQVPAQPVYFTDGPSRSLKVGSRVYRMKHVSASRLPQDDDPVQLVLHALRNAGPGGIDDDAAMTLRRRLSPDQRRQLVRRARYAEGWIADAARMIAQAGKDTVRG